MEQYPEYQHELNNEIPSLYVSLDALSISPKAYQTSNFKLYHQDKQDTKKDQIPDNQLSRESLKKESDQLRKELGKLQLKMRFNIQEISDKSAIVDKNMGIAEAMFTAARQKVATLKVRDILLMQGHINPPPLVVLVFKAIYYLLGRSISNLPLRRQERHAAAWPQLRTLIRDSLCRQIISLRIEEVHQAVISYVLKEYIYSEAWDISRIASCSVKAGILAQWVEGFAAKADILMKVEPMTKEIAFRKEELKGLQSKCQILKERISYLDTKLVVCRLQSQETKEKETSPAESFHLFAQK